MAETNLEGGLDTQDGVRAAVAYVMGELGVLDHPGEFPDGFYANEGVQNGQES